MKESTLVTLPVLYSCDNKIEHYHIKYKNNEYTIDDVVTFENLTQMVEHYQKDADGLVTQLNVPVEKKSGKVEYSVDSEDFKKSKSGVWSTDRCLRHSQMSVVQLGVWGTVNGRGGSLVSGGLCCVGTTGMGGKGNAEQRRMESTEITTLAQECN